MYLDLDVILAELKPEDWLASEVDIDSLDAPTTSVATGIELQYVMEDSWDRERVATAHREIQEAGIELVALNQEALDVAATLRMRYAPLNVFDSVHLGSAHTLGDPIVSTDTLYPDIDEVEHVDPRTLG